MNDPNRPEPDVLDTYTRPRMESTLGREVQLEGAGQPATQQSSGAHGSGQAAGHAATHFGDSGDPTSMAVLEAQEQERQRLAEELHDGPAQALANAIFQTEILERAIREDSRESNAVAQAELFSLRQILERELDTLRGYINQLRPSLDEAEGLDDALRDSAAANSGRAGMPIEVSIGAPGDMLGHAARTIVLRVAQESLRNIAKHSGASRAWLVTRTVEESGSSPQWQLEVGDDGKGFDIDVVTAHPNRRHFGLRFMRERAELLGSELSINTSPAAGTVVRLTMDL